MTLVTVGRMSRSSRRGAGHHRRNSSGIYSESLYLGYSLVLVRSARTANASSRTRGPGSILDITRANKKHERHRVFIRRSRDRRRRRSEDTPVSAPGLPCHLRIVHRLPTPRARPARPRMVGSRIGHRIRRRIGSAAAMRAPGVRIPPRRARPPASSGSAPTMKPHSATRRSPTRGGRASASRHALTLVAATSSSSTSRAARARARAASRRRSPRA